MTALSSEPIPAPKAGVPRSGVAGFGVPSCIYCPAPPYTGKARKDKAQGTVVVQATVTTGGRVTDISVTRSFSPDMDATAVKTISKWRFKPALGPDGTPAAVTLPIEVSFRLF
jgi:TonB family protein